MYLFFSSYKQISELSWVGLQSKRWTLLCITCPTFRKAILECETYCRSWFSYSLICMLIRSVICSKVLHIAYYMRCSFDHNISKGSSKCLRLLWSLNLYVEQLAFISKQDLKFYYKYQKELRNGDDKRIVSAAWEIEIFLELRVCWETVFKNLWRNWEGDNIMCIPKSLPTRGRWKHPVLVLLIQFIIFVLVNFAIYNFCFVSIVVCYCYSSFKFQVVKPLNFDLATRCAWSH